MAMTRTSASTTAQLKDYVVGEFPLCGISVAKSCNGATTISADGEHFNNKYTVTISNTGAGPVQNPAFIETADIDSTDYKCKLTHIGATDVVDVPLVKDAENVIAAALACGCIGHGHGRVRHPRQSVQQHGQRGGGRRSFGERLRGQRRLGQLCSGLPTVRFRRSTPDYQGNARTGSRMRNLVTPATTIDATLGLQVCVDIEVTNDSTETVEDILISDDKLPAGEIPAAFDPCSGRLPGVP